MNAALILGAIVAVPLLRFRVLARPQPYAALVDGARLVSVVDRDRIAMRSAVVELDLGCGSRPERSGSDTCSA